MKIYKYNRSYYFWCENNNAIKNLIENICKNNNIKIDDEDKNCCKYICVNIPRKQLYWEILRFPEYLELWADKTNASILDFYKDIIKGK